MRWRSLAGPTCSAIEELYASAVAYTAACAAKPKDTSFRQFSDACNRLEAAAEKYTGAWEAKRLADYVRMHFECHPPMPETIAIAWRDYLDARDGSPNT